MYNVIFGWGMEATVSFGIECIRVMQSSNTLPRRRIPGQGTTIVKIGLTGPDSRGEAGVFHLFDGLPATHLVPS